MLFLEHYDPYIPLGDALELPAVHGYVLPGAW
jgi:hypothetical protein